MTSIREHDVAPRPTSSSHTSGWPLIAICVGYFMVILDTTVVNVALPSLSRELHTGTAGLQWVVDSYTLAFAALLLSAGSLGDRRGAKGVFQSGIGLFLTCSLACGLAPTTGVLIVARALQGVGAALTVPASLALLQAAYPVRADRRRAFGVWGAVASIGAGAGPVLGGALVAAVGWRAVFFINLPIGVAGILLVAHFVDRCPPHPRRMDVPGQLAGVVGLAALTVALIEGGAIGWTAPVVMSACAVAVIAGVGFVLIERASPQPMLPLELFSSPTFSAATAVGLCMNLGFYGQFFVMTLYLQQQRGYSALMAGLALLPEMAVMTVASTLSGRVTASRGPRRPMLVGLCIGGIGLWGLTSISDKSSYLALVLPFVAAGFGMAFTMPAATTAVMEVAPPERGGLASATFSSARQVGGVLGVALLGTLVSTGHQFIAGLRLGMSVAGAVFLIGAGLTYVGVEHSGQSPRQEHGAAAEQGRMLTR